MQCVAEELKIEKTHTVVFVINVVVVGFLRKQTAVYRLKNDVLYSLTEVLLYHHPTIFMLIAFFFAWVCQKIIQIHKKKTPKKKKKKLFCGIHF